jgi:hypothetical protein
MIGSSATSEDDGRFTAWDGYIEGRTLEEVPPAKIVQAWRTSDFPEDAPDSILTIYFEAAPGGTKVTIQHTNIPDGQGASYESGWTEHYFEPMTRYFSSAGSKVKDVGAAIGHAFEEAEAQVEAVAHDALEAVETARKQARKQAVKAVKAVKRVQKKAVAQAKAVGKKVKALVQRKKKAPSKKAKPAGKATKKPVRKPARAAKAVSSARKASPRKARR